MTRLIAATLMSLSLCLCAPLAARDAQAAMLPIGLDIDLRGIANIEDHRARDDLETEIRSFLREYVVDQRLYEHWVVETDSSPGISRLSLIVEQAGARRSFNFVMKFSGHATRQVRHRGLRPENVPRQGDDFDADLLDALWEFVAEKDNEIYAASDVVHISTDTALKTVLQFERPLDDESAAYYFEDKLRLTWDQLDRSSTVSDMLGNRLFTYMLLNPRQTRTGMIRPEVKQSHGGELPEARFCIHRPLNPDPPAGTEPVVVLECPLAGTCALGDAMPANWADDQCQIPIHFERQVPFWPWGTAHAAVPNPESWSVPELDVLYDRVENHPGRFVGFTEFVLRARELDGLEADAFTVRVLANGVPILINGLKPKERMRPFDPTRGLIYRFGLENLKFAGREDGCENLSLALRFFRGGEPVGDELILTRGYAALRHAPQRSFETKYGKFLWDGRYVAPDNRNESGIFVASARYSTDDPEDERQALRRLNAMRKQLDGFGWTILASELGLGLGLESVLESSESDARLAIVGKLRPPRTIFDNGDAAYGLLVGVEEPSGQLQFTFDRGQIRALQSSLNALRAESPAARRIIPEQGGRTVFSYNEARRVAPDWVCRNP